MKRIYGYARISRKTQNIERQVRNISEAFPDAKISQEAYTGKMCIRDRYICLFWESEPQGGLNPDTMRPHKLPGKSEHRRECSHEAIQAHLRPFGSI